MANMKASAPSSRHMAGAGKRASISQGVHSGLQSGSSLRAAPALTLDRVIGQTCLHNSTLAVNPLTGDVAYPAGCIVVIYQPRRNRQFRYFRASKTVSCLAFSRDGSMLAVGEKGHQPVVTVWNLTTGLVLRELIGGHRFGVGCVSFTPDGQGVATMGFKHDRMLRVWDLQLARRVAGGDSQSPEGGTFSPSFPTDDLDPDASPPPPKRDRTPEAPATAPRREEAGARQIACARVPQRVRGMEFTLDRSCLVTCGDRSVKFWTIPEAFNPVRVKGDDATGRSDQNGVGATIGGNAREGDVPAPLEGKDATMVDELAGETFVDVACAKGGDRGEGEGRVGGAEVFCVTAAGVLCSFSRDGFIQRWVSLEVPSAYGLSIYEETVAAACANGLVRLFRTSDLGYTATLPRPPPLGHANIASIRELRDLTSSVPAAAAVSGARLKPADAWCSGSMEPGLLAREGETSGDGQRPNEGIFSASSGGATSASGDGGCKAGGGRPLRYPAVLACRISPSGTKVVCVYADRGLFIWDITDPLCVGKYRSFLAHGGCIWDVQRMPGLVPGLMERSIGSKQATTAPAALPDIPDGAMLTCSADNTVRLWDLGALDGRSDGECHSGRWSNIYCKHLLRTLYTEASGGRKRDTSNFDNGGNPFVFDTTADASNSIPKEFGGSLNGSVNGDTNDRSDTATSTGGVQNGATRGAEEAAAAYSLLSRGVFDPELPPMPDWSCAPRSIAVHPSGLQVACGDKCGNIRVYDFSDMKLLHEQAAHDAEVLCLAFSPILVPRPAPASMTVVHASSSMPSTLPADNTSAQRREQEEGQSEEAISAVNKSSVALHKKWEAVNPLGSSTLEQMSRAREFGDSGRGREAGTALVLLASASRDRLVHVFDASANARRDSRHSADSVPDHGAVKLGGLERGMDKGNRGMSELCYPLLKTLDDHSSSVTAVKFSKDGRRLISAGGDKMLVLNNVRGPHVHRFKSVSVPQGTIFGLDVDPTNKYMVTAGQDRRLNIWSIATGRHVRGYKVENPVVPLTPAVGAGGVGDAAGGGGASGVRSGGGELFKVDLDPTGMYAAACSFDKWIRLFDFYSGKCLAKVAGHSELATGVRFTSDGRRLVSTGGDGVMFVWRLSSELQQAMRDRMCELRASGSSDSVADGGGSGVSPKRSSTKMPTEPVSSDRGRPSTSDPPTAEGGGGSAGFAGPHTPAKVAEARAKAKADAKSRLRFQRFQLPAWAHTQKSTAASSDGNPIPVSLDSPKDVLPVDGGNSDSKNSGSSAVAPAPPPSRADEKSSVNISGAPPPGRRPASDVQQDDEHATSSTPGRAKDACGAGVGESFDTFADGRSNPDDTHLYTANASIHKSARNTAASAAISGARGAAVGDLGVVGGWGFRKGEVAGSLAVGAASAVPQGRWGKRVMEEGPLEVLGCLAGLQRKLPEHSSYEQGMLAAQSDEMSSREEEDSVLLVDSDEDGNDVYSEDGDFEQSHQSQQGQRSQQNRENERGNDITKGVGMTAVGDSQISSLDLLQDKNNGRTGINVICNAEAPRMTASRRQAQNEVPFIGQDRIEDRRHDFVAEGAGAVETSGLEEESYSWEDDDVNADVKASLTPEGDVREEAMSKAPCETALGGLNDGNALRSRRKEEKAVVDGTSVGVAESVDTTEGESSLRQSHSREFFQGLARGDHHRHSCSCSFEGSTGGVSVGDDDLDDVNFCTSSPEGAAVGTGDPVGTRGRRIIETEGAVENMRRRLSAMGFLESDTTRDDVMHSGDREPTTVGTHSVKVSANNEASKARNTNANGQHDAPGAVAGTVSRDGAVSRLDSEARVPTIDTEPSSESKIHPTEKDRSLEAKRIARKDEKYGSPANGDGIDAIFPSLPSSVPDEESVAAIINSKSEVIRAVAAIAVAASIESAAVAVESRSPTSASKGDDDVVVVEERVSTPDRRASGAGTSESRLRRLGRRLSQDVGTATGALPRPDEEYEAALLRLSAAAKHATELYRELTGAAVAVSRRRSPSSFSSREEVGVVETESFELEGPSTPQQEASGVPTSSKQQKQEPRFDTFYASAGKQSHDLEYHDRSLEQSEEAGISQGRERTRPLLQSYREGFASVNDVLSVISAETGQSCAERPATSKTFISAAARSSRSGADPARTDLSPSPRARRVWTASQSMSRRRADSPPGSRNVARNWYGSWSLADGNSNTNTRERSTQSSRSGGHGGQAGGSMDGGGALANDAVPAEVSGMLRCYSDMMLRAVQEKLDASLADGTLRSSSTREPPS